MKKLALRHEYILVLITSLIWSCSGIYFRIDNTKPTFWDAFNAKVLSNEIPDGVVITFVNILLGFLVYKISKM